MHKMFLGFIQARKEFYLGQVAHFLHLLAGSFDQLRIVVDLALGLGVVVGFEVEFHALCHLFLHECLDLSLDFCLDRGLHGIHHSYHWREIKWIIILHEVLRRVMFIVKWDSLLLLNRRHGMFLHLKWCLGMIWKLQR